MDKHTSITQVCNVPPKGLINIFIFILINLKCYYQAEDPYLERCWTTRTDYRYPGTVGVIRYQTLEECQAFCRYELDCSLVVFDFPSTTIKCSVLSSSGPMDYSRFQWITKVKTYVLGCKGSVKLRPSCWITKGDYKFEGLEHFNKPGVTIEECKNRCLNETACDVISFDHFVSGGPKCYIKTHDGPLDKFVAAEGITSYTFNKTCLEIIEARDIRTFAEPTFKPASESSSETTLTFLVVLATIVLLAGAIYFVLFVILKPKDKAKISPEDEEDDEDKEDEEEEEKKINSEASSKSGKVRKKEKISTSDKVRKSKKSDKDQISQLSADSAA